MTGPGFLETPEHTADAQQLFDDDIAELGYVMNASRLWAYQPATQAGLFDLLGSVVGAGGLGYRTRSILVVACASAYQDSYCSLAWGGRLAGAADEQTAAAVVRGDDHGLTDGERAMAEWARKVARDPNSTTAADVQVLRDVGFDDAQIFAMTTFVALRIAFSTVNDALGLRPDAALRATVPAPVLDAVTYGRPIDDAT